MRALPQMVSLLHLAVITEEGVAFQSPHDGRDMLLTPEHSIAIQNRLGAPSNLILWRGTHFTSWQSLPSQPAWFRA